jgi:hypothetical protein
MITVNESQQAFGQQGSLDWVALGRTQYSVSIAILGRLAKAGIDTLTVAFGQAMCLQLPIGIHGERVLTDSMSGLTAKSFAADLLWFGVGVRHILRELVQTSQGCSLIALCAALTESHSISVSALVLYEIAKECGGPQELAPSLEQWEALIRIAASVFNATTFGLRIHQIAKFGITHQGRTSTRPSTSHPSDLAKLLLSLGQIVHGNLQSVSIHGGSCCSWIAAWADFVLGLRVLVRDTDGNIVYTNYNTKETFAQVNIRFVEDESHGRMLCVQSSHMIRSGTEFIQKCFGRQRLAHSAGSDVVFCPGRLHWDTMFSDTFGDQFMVLIKRKGGEHFPPQPFAREEAREDSRQWGLDEPSSLLTADQIFSRLLGIAIIVLAVLGTADIRSGGARRYLVRACESIPELRQCNEQILFAITNFLTLYGPEDSLLDCSKQSDLPAIQQLVQEYAQYNYRLRGLCRCDRCSRSESGNITQFCLPQLVKTVLCTISLLDRTVLDAPLTPTMYGLYHLYDTFAPPVTYGLTSISLSHEDTTSHPVGFFNYITQSMDGDCGVAFPTIAALFSAEDWTVELNGNIAQSDGKVYCYTQLLEELTNNIQEARKIHVGSGPIEYRGRLHRALYDTHGRTESFLGYSAHETGVVDSIDYLRFDSTSNPINAQLVVEEEPGHLYLRHHISTERGETLIAPTILFQRLQKATSYKYSNRYATSASESWIPVLRGFQYILVHGEGLVDKSDRCHVLRPLSRNILGECVAISKTTCPMALVKTDEELELFARVWAVERDRYQQSGHPLNYYVLIS